MKKIIIFIGSIILISGFCFGMYWRNMSQAERWLFFNNKIALQYSIQLLTSQSALKVPNELIDMHISKKPGLITFDSNDQDHFFVLAYSPYGVPEPIISSGRTITWKGLKDNWYELLQ
ncbi:MAG: hypothetical protein M0023_02185 [Desulfobacteraceae bacterium]|nr:hypothetical protein [Desulfobacteraceae bacterium]